MIKAITIREDKEFREEFYGETSMNLADGLGVRINKNSVSIGNYKEKIGNYGPSLHSLTHDVTISDDRVTIECCASYPELPECQCFPYRVFVYFYPGTGKTQLVYYSFDSPKRKTIFDIDEDFNITPGIRIGHWDDTYEDTIEYPYADEVPIVTNINYFEDFVKSTFDFVHNNDGVYYYSASEPGGYGYFVLIDTDNQNVTMRLVYFKEKEDPQLLLELTFLKNGIAMLRNSSNARYAILFSNALDEYYNISMFKEDLNSEIDDYGYEFILNKYKHDYTYTTRQEFKEFLAKRQK